MKYPAIMPHAQHPLLHLPRPGFPLSSILLSIGRFGARFSSSGYTDVVSCARHAASAAGINQVLHRVDSVLHGAAAATKEYLPPMTFSTAFCPARLLQR